MRDRYLKVILTIIAVELGWIALNQVTSPVGAQAAATPVVIRGIELNPGLGDNPAGFLPVAVVGGYRQIPGTAVNQLQRVQVSVPTAVDVRTIAPVKIETDRPIKIEADRALKVESVPYTPAQKPGE
jgi:hypothetical protein